MGNTNCDFCRDKCRMWCRCGCHEEAQLTIRGKGIAGVNHE